MYVYILYYYIYIYKEIILDFFQLKDPVIYIYEALIFDVIYFY